MSTMYDFDKVISRYDTDSAKWDMAEAIFGEKDVLPMWVADMDFPIAREITDALQKRADHEIYGYTVPGASANMAVINRMKEKFGWDIKPEWIIFTPGIVPALYVAVKAFTTPGDDVIIQDPVYRPFWSAALDNGCHIVNNALRLSNYRYEIDFHRLESQFQYSQNPGLMQSRSRVQMMILCSPHNPVGRVWTREELSRLGDICIQHNAVMISDEIHCELLFEGATHIPFGSISPAFEQQSLTCISPSKTFNIAGLGVSAVIIPNSDLRRRFNKAKTGFLPMVNPFGVAALVAAYNHGDDWLSQMLAYLQENLLALTDFLAERLPKVRLIKPEGTYLAWLDFRNLGMDRMALRAFLREKARLGLEDGFVFGPSGEGFQRMNFACPRATLTEALERLAQAVDSL